MNLFTANRIIKANILVDDDGKPQISDFGLVRVAQIQTLMKSQTNIGRGTMRWQAPELISGEHQSYDAEKCDVYAFGMVIYEVC